MQQTDDWRAVAACTEPADRAAAEAAVRIAYRSAGLAEPALICWADSPLAGLNTVRALENPGASVREQVRTLPWARERRRVHEALGADSWNELWQATGAQLWEVTRTLTDRIRSGVVEAVLGPEPIETDSGRRNFGRGTRGNEERRERAAAEAEIRGVLLDAVHGQHDAPWLAAFDGTGDRLAGLAGVARHAGWWWPFENAVVLTERPLRLARDEAGRLHSGDGPALVYPDGFALYAWGGMPVPADFLDGLNTLTPERIRAEENAELRRVMLEHFGYDRYLAESNAQPVHRDETGILWRIALPDDEDVAMVEVVNSTAEPDGTYRTYWLRVPPRTRTAREGVAWTFGLTADEYDPLRQT
ncbi:hypothetical protein JK358_29975 [Nocardia sp. 2]|uniref:DUF6745 domain-containing protein n=1 Tax=Nocardia acididurans TaxID=2802282 RepID=A0ABS1MG09_9NOCA|nr:hypothetical protein [Nocardia acididurans]MBL1078639.1 hypothetical protein [Nocardia acididurans]